MRYKRRPIRIKYYTPFSRRTIIFGEKKKSLFLRYAALSKDEFKEYQKSLYSLVKAIDEIKLGKKVEIIVKPWGAYFWESFFRKGFKSPSVIVDNELVSSGDVPDPKKIKDTVYRAESRHQFLEND